LRKSFSFFLIAFLIFLFLPILVTAEETQSFDAVYFASRYCSDCQRLEDEGVLDELVADGYSIRIIYLEDDKAATQLLYDFQYTYQLDYGKTILTPILFVGDQHFAGYTGIKQAYLNGDIQLLMDTVPLLIIERAPDANFSLISFILLGLVDGINPCAIAMLLLFISLLNFTDNKKTLIKISVIFITAIYLSYFLFGTLLYTSLSKLGQLVPILKIVPWIVIGIAAIVALLNLYDFVMTLLKRYDKVKNQLPSRIQTFNRKLMTRFTAKLEEGSFSIYLIAFLVGVVISFTEFLCTGQAYLTAILHLIHFSDHLWRGIILLIIYNFIFILPLVIIAVIAIKTQSIIRVSTFMRKNLHWIKLFNAIIFILLILYYLNYLT